MLFLFSGVSESPPLVAKYGCMSIMTKADPAKRLKLRKKKTKKKTFFINSFRHLTKKVKFN